MGGRKGQLKEWEEEADLNAGSEGVFRVHLGRLMGCGTVGWEGGWKGQG